MTVPHFNAAYLDTVKSRAPFLAPHLTGASATVIEWITSVVAERSPKLLDVLPFGWQFHLLSETPVLPGNAVMFDQITDYAHYVSTHHPNQWTPISLPPIDVPQIATGAGVSDGASADSFLDWWRSSGLGVIATHLALLEASGCLTPANNHHALRSLATVASSANAPLVSLRAAVGLACMLASLPYSAHPVAVRAPSRHGANTAATSIHHPTGDGVDVLGLLLTCPRLLTATTIRAARLGHPDLPTARAIVANSEAGRRAVSTGALAVTADDIDAVDAAVNVANSLAMAARRAAAAAAAGSSSGSPPSAAAAAWRTAVATAADAAVAATRAAVGDLVIDRAAITGPLPVTAKAVANGLGLGATRHIPARIAVQTLPLVAVSLARSAAAHAAIASRLERQRFIVNEWMFATAPLPTAALSGRAVKSSWADLSSFISSTAMSSIPSVATIGCALGTDPGAMQAAWAALRDRLGTAVAAGVVAGHPPSLSLSAHCISETLSALSATAGAAAAAAVIRAHPTFIYRVVVGAAALASYEDSTVVPTALAVASGGVQAAGRVDAYAIAAPPGACGAYVHGIAERVGGVLRDSFMVHPGPAVDGAQVPAGRTVLPAQYVWIAIAGELDHRHRAGRFSVADCGAAIGAVDRFLSDPAVAVDAAIRARSIYGLGDVLSVRADGLPPTAAQPRADASGEGEEPAGWLAHLGDSAADGPAEDDAARSRDAAGTLAGAWGWSDDGDAHDSVFGAVGWGGAEDDDDVGVGARGGGAVVMIDGGVCADAQLVADDVVATAVTAASPAVAAPRSVTHALTNMFTGERRARSARLWTAFVTHANDHYAVTLDVGQVAVGLGGAPAASEAAAAPHGLWGAASPPAADDVHVTTAARIADPAAMAAALSPPVVGPPPLQAGLPHPHPTSVLPAIAIPPFDIGATFTQVVVHCYGHVPLARHLCSIYPPFLFSSNARPRILLSFLINTLVGSGADADVAACVAAVAQIPAASWGRLLSLRALDGSHSGAVATGGREPEYARVLHARARALRGMLGDSATAAVIAADPLVLLVPEAVAAAAVGRLRSASIDAGAVEARVLEDPYGILSSGGRGPAAAAGGGPRHAPHGGGGARPQRPAGLGSVHGVGHGGGTGRAPPRAVPVGGGIPRAW